MMCFVCMVVNEPHKHTEPFRLQLQCAESQRRKSHQTNSSLTFPHVLALITVSSCCLSLQFGVTWSLIFEFAVYHHQSEVEAGGGAGAGEETHQVKRKGRRLPGRSTDMPTSRRAPSHQSNRILSAQTRMLCYSVCGNASAPLVGVHPIHSSRIPWEQILILS